MFFPLSRLETMWRNIPLDAPAAPIAFSIHTARAKDEALQPLFSFLLEEGTCEIPSGGR
jgi:hypothetical protein